jgi:hypothetical protein
MGAIVSVLPYFFNDIVALLRAGVRRVCNPAARHAGLRSGDRDDPNRRRGGMPSPVRWPSISLDGAVPRHHHDVMLDRLAAIEVLVVAHAGDPDGAHRG